MQEKTTTSVKELIVSYVFITYYSVLDIFHETVAGQNVVWTSIYTMLMLVRDGVPFTYIADMD